MDLALLRSALVPCLANGLWSAALGALPAGYPIPSSKSDSEGLTKTLDALNTSRQQTDGSLPLRDVLDRLRLATTEASLKKHLDEVLVKVDAWTPPGTDDDDEVPQVPVVPERRNWLAIAIEVFAFLACGAMLVWIVLDADIARSPMSRIIVAFVLAFLLTAVLMERLGNGFKKRLRRAVALSSTAAALVAAALLIRDATSSPGPAARVSVYHILEGGNEVSWVNPSAVSLGSSTGVSAYVDGNTVILLFTQRTSTTLTLTDTGGNATYDRNVSFRDAEQTLDVQKHFKRR